MRGESALFYQNVAETVLDTDLYASEVLPIETAEHYDQIDIRLFAHNMALRALAQVRGVHFDARNTAAVDALRDIPSASENRAAQMLLGPHIDTLRGKVKRAHYLSGARSTIEAEQWDDPGLQARAQFQHKVIGRIWEQMQKVRVMHNDPNNIEQILQNGMVVVAPPGAGKTYMASRLLQMCSVGSKVFSTDEQPQSALVAVPSLRLVEQYLSESPRNIFRKLLGWDTPMGEYHGSAKQISPITLITHHSFRNAVKEGRIKHGDFDYIVFDEVHHLSAPGNYEAMRRLGASLFGLTASDLYSAGRNLRTWFPHEGGGSFVDFIHAGILNPMEISTYTAEDRGAAATTAAKLTADWINDGLRVATYCLPGGGGAQSKVVADLANRILGKDLVRPIGRYAGNTSNADIAAFASGELRGLAPTGMLKEGWDEDVDGVIIVGPRYSMVDVLQMAGRSSRLGSKMSRLAEVNATDTKNYAHRSSVWQVLGLESISSSYNLVIGRDVQNRRRYPERVDAMDASLSDPLPLHDPVKRMIITEEGVDTMVPQGLLCIDELACDFKTSSAYLRAVFQKNGMRLFTRSSVVAGEKIEEYWVDEQAVEYLRQNPPLRVDPTSKNGSELAVELNLPPRIIHWAAAECGIRTKFFADPESGGYRRRYTGLDAEKITAFMKTIPHATDGDVLQAELVRKVGTEFLQQAMEKYGVAPKNKLLHSGSFYGVKGYFNHADAEVIIKEHQRITGGEQDSEPSKKRLPEHLVPVIAAKRRFELSDEELAALFRRRAAGIAKYV